MRCEYEFIIIYILLLIKLEVNLMLKLFKIYNLIIYN